MNDLENLLPPLEPQAETDAAQDWLAASKEGLNKEMALLQKKLDARKISPKKFEIKKEKLIKKFDERVEQILL